MLFKNVYIDREINGFLQRNAYIRRRDEIFNFT